MRKLFSMEDTDSGSSNDLLIDKLINATKQPEKPLSLTTDILKQRQVLEKQIAEQLQGGEETDDESDSSDDVDESESSSDETESEEGTEESTDEETEESETDSEDKDSKEEEEPKDDKKDDSDDDEPVGDDEESIDAIMGSGLSAGGDDFRDDKKDDKKDEKKDEKKEVAKESFKINSRPKKKHLKDIFTPIVTQYNSYLKGLTQYGLESEAKPIQKQPIVYVKESVLESLDNLIEAAKVYVDNNAKFVEGASKNAADVNERLTVFAKFVTDEKYRFTHQLVDDKDVLGALANENTSEPRDTSKVLIKYVESINQAIIYALGNDYDNLPSSFTNVGFTEAEGDLVYKTMLPGFNMIRVHLEEYRNYLNTNVGEFEFYKLKVLKTEDLYNLKAIGVTEDKDLLYIVDAMVKLFASLVTTVDNVNDITTNFSKLIDEIKVIRHDVDKDVYTDLTQVDVDGKVKDFIRFKLAIEAFYISYNLLTDYMVGLFSVLNIVVELKE